MVVFSYQFSSKVFTYLHETLEGLDILLAIWRFSELANYEKFAIFIYWNYSYNKSMALSTKILV